MLKLDIGTVGLFTAILSIVVSFAVPGRTKDSTSRLQFYLFFLTTALYGVGLLAILLRGTLPPYLAVIGGNLLVLLAGVTLHAGVCVIVQRAPLTKLYLALVVCFLVGDSYYLIVEDNINARIVVISALRSTLFIHAGVMLHRARSQAASLGLSILESVVGVWVFLLIFRSLDALFVIAPVASFVALTGVQAIYILATGLGNVLLVTALYRLEAEGLTRGLAERNAELTKTNQVMLKEIEDRKEVERNLQQSKEATEAANASKSRFLAAASHDLRQPMQAINLFLDALRRTHLDTEQQRIASYLEVSKKTLSELLDSLLDISRLDAGVVKQQPTLIDFFEIFSRLERECGHLAIEKKLRFLLHYPTKQMAFRTDPTLLIGILRNLISNAIRYTVRGGILVSARLRSDHLLFQVWDTGIGIADEHQPRIFEEFYQVNNVERDRTKGLGLGLSIVRRQADLLGYQVSCRSRPGRGSVFSLRIPIDAVEMGAVVESKVMTEMRDDDVSQLRGLRIVLVEDDLLVSEAWSNWLLSLGVEAVRFIDAKQALDSADIADADVYISDFRLPGEMNGIEMLNAIQDRAHRNIAGIVVTGDTSSKKLQDLDAVEWLVLHKPVEPQTLLAAILSVRKLKQMADEV
jgi:signal transduction histidine kinase